MNDYMEVQHGINCVVKTFHGEKFGKKFQAALDNLFQGAAREIAQRFDNWTPNFRSNTYLVCVSEHEDSEDTLGRLSMWRAYSGSTGVALVLNGDPFLGDAVEFKAYTSPVTYHDDVGFEAVLGQVAGNIERNSDFLKSLGRESLINIVFMMLRFLTISTKHPGFSEEKEWRVIYSPADDSPYLEKELQVINGVPQTIYKIPLKDIPAIGLTGMEIPSLIHRVIIGPTQHPIAVRKAFVTALLNAEVADAEKRVWVSQIPLRT